MADETDLAAVPDFPGAKQNRRQRVAEWLLTRAPEFPPGSDFAYSNGGYAVLAALAERVTGQDWETLLKARLFEPFGMADAGFGWPGGEGAPYGHMRDAETVVPIAPQQSFQFPSWLVPAGDVHASMADMGSFMQQYLRAWSGEHALISREAVQALFTPGIKSALGWGIQSFNGHQRVAVHEGSAETFTMMIAIFPGADRGVVVAANGADSDTRRTIIEILQQLAPLAAESP